MKFPFLTVLLLSVSLLCFSVSVHAGIVGGVVKGRGESPRSAATRDEAAQSIEQFKAFLPSLSFVTQNLLQESLSRFSCTDDACLMDFAEKAKIDIIIVVSAEETVDGTNILCESRSPALPYNGKKIFSYSGFIPRKGLSNEAIQLLISEHTGRFLSTLLQKYKAAVPAVFENGRLRLPSRDNGSYEVLHVLKDSGGIFYESYGNETFVAGLSQLSRYDAGEKYFILTRYEKEALAFAEYLYGRKHEMLFPSVSEESKYKVLFFVPALSALSPLALPLGYYRTGDYSGFVLAAGASAPWAVISARNLNNAYRNKDKILSSRERGGRNFGLYWFFGGNASLIVDMYAHEAFADVRYYRQGEYLGHTSTAVALAAMTPGGGLFYRGERLYGHLYYQAGNALIYKTLLSFASSDSIDANGQRVQKKPDRKKAYMWMSGLIALKTVEIIHTVLTPDRIEADAQTSRLEFVPMFEYDGSVRAGAGVAFRW